MRTITAAIYGGGPFYFGGQKVIDDLKGSGFTTVVAWCIHVAEDGTLVYNDEPVLVRAGEYVAGPEWPKQLADLKQGGSVKTLLFSVGSGGVQDFHHIQSLIESQGTGPDSILYRSFKALKGAIPDIDAIDFDDEDLFDQNTTVEFALMLHKLGYHVTFCPYFSPTFWVTCLHDLEVKHPGLVTGFNLQCYSGGSGNDPQPWIDAIREKMGPGFDAKGFVFPGLWSRHGGDCQEGDCPSDIKARFAEWKPTGIRGGFIWLYDDIRKCADSGTCPGPMNSKDYAEAIVRGLS